VSFFGCCAIALLNEKACVKEMIKRKRGVAILLLMDAEMLCGVK
jgi:hypothetical protein